MFRVARNEHHLAGGEIVTIDEIVADIRSKVTQEGRMSSAAIAEQFDLLRTIQLVECGYYKRL